MMKYLKTILLYLLLLIALMLCSVLALKIMDAILSLDHIDIWQVGPKCGGIAWLIITGISLWKRFTASDQNQHLD